MRTLLFPTAALAAFIAFPLGAAAPDAAGQPQDADTFDETITVHAASRRSERLLEAPAAVTVLGEEEIPARNASGELAQALAGTPGLELNQEGSGSYDLNVRGFGGDMNRRIAIVVDGRDVATPQSGSYEWNLFSNLADLAQVELVRGPASTLWGANAYNGVLSLVTRSAAEGGGRARLAVGDPASARGDLSWSRRLAGPWSAKLAASAGESDTFLRDRSRSVEYDGLPLEAIAPPRDRTRFGQLALRLDRATQRGLFTAEAGRSEATGTTRVTGAGRMQTTEPDRRTWARAALDDPRGRLAAFWNDVAIPERVLLSYGGPISEQSSNWRVEAERDQVLFAGAVRLHLGASYGEESVDTANAAGVQTTLLRAVRSEASALFAQLDVPAGEAFRLLAGARWDDSSLYSGHLSPKLGVVWIPGGAQSVRLTAQRAFQEPNDFELFSDLPSYVAFDGGFGPTVDLSAVESALCAPYGVDCGFATPTPSRQRGNANLDVEQISTVELGWTRQLGAEGWLQATYYRSRLDHFISESLPNPFGAINPDYAPYRPPAGHPDPAALAAALAAALGPLFPFLTRDGNGTPLLVTYSLTNAARVDAQGVELGARRQLARRWRGELAYSWFDFDVVDPGYAAEIVPNAPRQSGSVALDWRGERATAWARWRWVESFRWAIGGFDGRVPTFDVLTLGGRHELGRGAAARGRERPRPALLRGFRRRPARPALDGRARRALVSRR
jgi:outer membrane receptor protein involved in Fe transport